MYHRYSIVCVRTNQKAMIIHLFNDEFVIIQMYAFRYLNKSQSSGLNNRYFWSLVAPMNTKFVMCRACLIA